MGWCPYCAGDCSPYTCKLTNEYAPYSYVSNFCKNYNKCGECPNYKQYGPSTSSGPCFITTVTCDILGKDDNDIVMQKLRSFRDNILQKNEEYHDILKMYDSIGPVIVENLVNDSEKEIITPKLYSILERITRLIDKCKNKHAVEKYRQMTLLLIHKYGLENEYDEMKNNGYGYTNDNFDPDSAGHGIRLINEDLPKM